MFGLPSGGPFASCFRPLPEGPAAALAEILGVPDLDSGVEGFSNYKSSKTSNWHCVHHNFSVIHSTHCCSVCAKSNSREIHVTESPKLYMVI